MKSSLISRKEVIKKFRQNVNFDSVYTYSDKRVNSQRWKLWCVYGDYKAIADSMRCVIGSNQYPDLYVEAYTSWSFRGPVKNIVVNFPNKYYKE